MQALGAWEPQKVGRRPSLPHLLLLPREPQACGQVGRGPVNQLYEGSHPSVWWAPNSKSTLFPLGGVRSKDVSCTPKTMLPEKRGTPLQEAAESIHPSLGQRVQSWSPALVSLYLPGLPPRVSTSQEHHPAHTVSVNSMAKSQTGALEHR